MGARTRIPRGIKRPKRIEARKNEPKSFDPSPRSLTPRERTLLALRYLQRTARKLEKDIEAGAELPSWVLVRIDQSAVALGMAANYMKRRQQ